MSPEIPSNSMVQKKDDVEASPPALAPSFLVSCASATVEAATPSVSSKLPDNFTSPRAKCKGLSKSETRAKLFCPIAPQSPTQAMGASLVSLAATPGTPLKEARLDVALFTMGAFFFSSVIICLPPDVILNSEICKVEYATT